MAYDIIQSVETDFSFKKEENRSDILLAFLEIIEVFSDTHLSKIIHSLKDNNLTSEDNILSEIKEKKDVQNTVKIFLDSLLLEKGDRLIVFIDELDRCKPDYAVRVLERIKHYFTNERITFVFSINTKELQHTIKRFYGDEFDGYKYLDRFFDLRITLPNANLQKYYLSIGFDDNDSIFNLIKNEVIKKYEFELREISKYLKSIKTAKNFFIGTPCTPTEKGLFFGYNYIIPVMLGMKIYNAEMYRDFIDGKSYKLLVEVFNRLDKAYFGILLKPNEVFAENLIHNGDVIFRRKIEEVYNAVFDNNKDYFIDIGQCRFERGIKEKLIEISNQLYSYVTVFSEYD